MSHPALICRRLAGAAALLAFAAAPLSASWGAEPAYAVGPGDELRITVYGELQLSGLFKVDSEGNLNYPLLGVVPVEGMTTQAISEKFVTELGERVSTGRFVAVDVNRYAPVFILGEVERPGQYEYHPGMLVMELVALAGGVRRAVAREGRMTQLISTERELAEVRIQRYGLTVQRARLNAELSGTEFEGLPPDPAHPIEARMSRQIVANEVALFAVRRTALQNQVDTLLAQQAGYQSEVEILSQSIKLFDDELRLLGEEVAATESLARRGLAAQVKLSALQREFSATQRNFLDVRSYLARAKQKQLEVDQRLVELREARRSEVAQLLRDVEISIARFDKQITALSHTIVELDGGAAPNEAFAPASFVLTRADDSGEHRSMRVAELGQLKARDIVRVERSPDAVQTATVPRSEAQARVTAPAAP